MNEISEKAKKLIVTLNQNAIGDTAYWEFIKKQKQMTASFCSSPTFLNTENALIDLYFQQYYYAKAHGILVNAEHTDTIQMHNLEVAVCSKIVSDLRKSIGFFDSVPVILNEAGDLIRCEKPKNLLNNWIFEKGISVDALINHSPYTREQIFDIMKGKYEINSAVFFLLTYPLHLSYNDLICAFTELHLDNDAYALSIIQMVADSNYSPGINGSDIVHYIKKNFKNVKLSRILKRVHKNMETIMKPTVFLTGAGGFIGRELVRQLSNLYHLVVLTHDLDPDKLNNFPSDTVFYKTDLSGNENKRNAVFQRILFENDIASVVWLAAMPLRNNAEAQAQYDLNVESINAFLRHLAEQKCYVKSVIIPSTTLVYGAHKDGRECKEDDPLLSSDDPYISSKITIETRARQHAREFGTPVFLPRFCHIYGPEDFSRRLIPVLISGIQKRTPITLNRCSDGEYDKIDLVSVKDAAGSIRFLIAKSFDPGFVYTDRHAVFNVASGCTYSLYEVYSMLAKALGAEISDIKLEISELSRLHSTEKISVSKFEELGWHASVSLEQGVEDIVITLNKKEDDEA